MSEFQKYFEWKQVLVFAVIICATVAIAQVLHFLVNRRLIRKNRLLLKDPTRLKFFSHVSTAFVYVIGFATAMSQIDLLKPISTSLLAGAGLLTVAVSFASQNALSNIISGFFIVLFRPFGVNDRLRFRENIIGIVEDITLRHTIIRDGENKRVIIPNALINNEVVINYDFHEEHINKSVDLLLHYSSNIAGAKALIRDVVMAHPLFINTVAHKTNATPHDIVPINITTVNEKGITMQVIISSKSIVDANKIVFALLEELIVKLPSHGAFFVHQDGMQAAAPASDTSLDGDSARLINDKEETNTIADPGSSSSGKPGDENSSGNI